LESEEALQDYFYTKELIFTVMEGIEAQNETI